MARRHIEEGTRVTASPLYAARKRTFIVGGKHLYSGFRDTANTTEVPIGTLGTVTNVGTCRYFQDHYKRYLVDFDDIGPLWTDASDIKNV